MAAMDKSDGCTGRLVLPLNGQVTLFYLTQLHVHKLRLCVKNNLHAFSSSSVSDSGEWARFWVTLMDARGSLSYTRFMFLFSGFLPFFDDNRNRGMSVVLLSMLLLLFFFSVNLPPTPHPMGLPDATGADWGTVWVGILRTTRVAAESQSSYKGADTVYISITAGRSRNVWTKPPENWINSSLEANTVR